GKVYASFSNGERLLQGQVVLASFVNAEGLKNISGTAWTETAASGAALLGAPGVGQLGSLTPGALESSNVDLTQQRVGVMEGQRNYQANTQVISSNKEMTQVLFNALGGCAMDRLGYTATTAAGRPLMPLQVRANNLANVNTPGFRADLERAQTVVVEGYGYDGRHMALVENNGVNLAAGPMMATGRELDFAVKGTGLIVLQDGEGEAYTRQGSMQIDSEGRLTLNGRAVMGENGPIELP